MVASARLEVRVRQDSRARPERAAKYSQVPLSDFVRSAAEDSANQVLADHEATTRVPGAGTGAGAIRVSSVRHGGFGTVTVDRSRR